jgi:hypothetical protein
MQYRTARLKKQPHQHENCENAEQLQHSICLISRAQHPSHVSCNAMPSGAGTSNIENAAMNVTALSAWRDGQLR